MKVFLNILWYFPFFGFLLAIPTALGGLLLCLTVVGLPLGLGLLQIAKFLLAPHTRELVSQKDISAAKGEDRNKLWVIFSTIVRILYFPVGLFVAIAYIFDALFCFISIIGIPNGLVIVKLIPAVFNPVGKVCVGGAIARKIKADKDQKEVDAYFNKSESGVVAIEASVTIETSSPEEIAMAEQRAAEEAAELALQQEELRLQKEAEAQKRKEQIQKVTDFLVTYKYKIGGAIAAIAIVWFTLWYTSDSHRYNVAVEAEMASDYNKAITWASKISSKSSKYYQPALILGLNAYDAGKPTDWLSKGSISKGQELEKRLTKYVESTPFNEKSYYAHVYHNQRIVRSINMLDLDTIADRQKWLTIANSFNNASFSGRNCEYFYAQAKFAAAFAYFMGAEFDKSAEIFELLEHGGNHEISKYAKGYLGVMNLFRVVQNPCSRADAYEMILGGPDDGIFPMYKGDASVCHDASLRYGTSLRDRIVKAKEYYDMANPPVLPGNIVEQVTVRREIMGKMVETRPWDYYGYDYDSGRGHYCGPTGWDGNPNGWGVFYYKEKGEITWMRFGKYRTSNHVVNLKQLALWFNDDESLSAYMVNDKQYWDWYVNPGSINPYEFFVYQTLLFEGLTPSYFYETPASPIYSTSKAEKLNKRMEEMYGADEFIMDYEE